MTRAPHFFSLLALLCLLADRQAIAYVGPGAGFALAGGAWTFVILVVAALSILLLPLRLLGLWWRRRKKSGATVKRVVVLGLDGFDPQLAAQYMEQGRLPHLQQLAERGSFGKLATSLPAITPSAWSSFATGVDASRHNIFDFITRDAMTYAPVLSSASIAPPARVWQIGKYRIPLSRPRVRNLRKSQLFWKILGRYGIFSSIVRVPITFPPEKFDNGTLLSGMCVPDLRGTQGEFTYFTSDALDQVPSQGECVHVDIDNGRGQSVLRGPADPLRQDRRDLAIPLAIDIDAQTSRAVLDLAGQRIELTEGQYTPWTELTFKAGPGVKVRGICRFYLISAAPFKLYVTPLQIDPEAPSLPISQPDYFAVYLAKRLGKFGTLGLLEDTDALNVGVLSEEAFLAQAYLIQEERERMLFHALEQTREGLVCCVCDGTDRIQHMFFRTLEADHPANRGREVEAYAAVIPELYARMDALVGRLVEQVGDDPETVLLVLSDHGFCQFKRGVNLNTWLYDNGYLVLKEGASGQEEWLVEVDWQRTKAFALGLTGLFINRQGREAQGIVEEGAELAALKEELVQGLTGLRDPDNGAVAINQAWDAEEFFSGPYLADAPDILVGYNAGYRISWSGATGTVAATVFEDNTKCWSGDHCVDPRLVPGVLFSNRKVEQQDAHLLDLAPTILKLFGIDPPTYMQGRDLFAVPTDEASSGQATDATASRSMQETEV